MDKTLGTKWFNFYTGIRPVYSVFYYIYALVDFFQYIDLYMQNWWLLLNIVVSTIGIFLYIVLSITAHSDYRKFIKFVGGFLWYETIGTAYSTAVEQYIRSNFSIQNALLLGGITFVAMYFIWYRTNMRYFTKRIKLDGTSQTKSEAKNKSGPISALVQQDGNYSPASGSIPTSHQCRKCHKEIDAAFSHCPHCGTKQAQFKIIVSVKKILIISACVIVIIMTAVLSAFFIINYQNGIDSVENRRFISAQRYFDRIPYSRKLFPQEWEFIDVGVLMEQGKYTEALDACANAIYPLPTSFTDGLIESIYKQAQNLYRAGKNIDSKELFSKIKGYERSNDYLTLINAKRSQEAYSKVVELISFEDAADIILENWNYSNTFFSGAWYSENKTHYFKMDDEGYVTNNLPEKGYGEHYILRNGVYSVGDEKRGYTACFKFTILDKNKVSVFCYGNNKSYILYKEK